MRLFTSGLTGLILVLSLSLVTYALWPLLWPYAALLIMILLTAAMWAALDVVYRVWHGLIESHPVEVAGQLPQYALTGYGRTVDDIAKAQDWQTAYEQLLLIASMNGGSYSFESMKPHISDSPRAYWEWSKAELERVKAIERTPRGYVLAGDYRIIRAKWRGSILPRPLPHPDRPAPMLRL